MSQNTFIVLPSARKDLESIGDFWGENSRDKVVKLFSAVRSQLDLLADMPYIGSPCNYSKPHLHSIRKSPVKGFRSYLIYYRPLSSGDGIVVLRIARHSRDIQPLLKESLEDSD